MGNQAAQFQRAVREGDTSKAYSLYYTKEAVRTKVEPNVALGAEYDGNTLLHFMAYHAMKKLYEDMINQHKGKPDFKNDKRQNCLHLLCATGEEGSVKRDMLAFTLSVGLPGMDLGHLLKEKDLVKELESWVVAKGEDRVLELLENQGWWNYSWGRGCG